MCLIRVSPSKLTLADSFLFSFYKSGAPPLDVSGRTLNPIIGFFYRNSSFFIDNGFVLDFTGRRPSGWEFGVRFWTQKPVKWLLIV